MPAAICPTGHAVSTPKGVPAPTTCPLASCGLGTTSRSDEFGRLVRSGVPTRPTVRVLDAPRLPVAGIPVAWSAGDVAVCADTALADVLCENPY